MIIQEFIVYRNNNHFNLLQENSINLHFKENKASLIREKHDELKNSIRLLINKMQKNVQSLSFLIQYMLNILAKNVQIYIMKYLIF